MNNLTLLKFWLEKQKVAYHKHDGFLEHPVAVKDHNKFFLGGELKQPFGGLQTEKKVKFVAHKEIVSLPIELRNKILSSLKVGLSSLPVSLAKIIRVKKISLAPAKEDLGGKYYYRQGKLELFIEPKDLQDEEDFKFLQRSLIHELIHSTYLSFDIGVQNTEKYNQILKSDEGFFDDVTARAYYDLNRLYERLDIKYPYERDEEQKMDRLQRMFEEDFTHSLATLLVFPEKMESFPKHVAFFKELGLVK